jgi:hypothetical protein
MRSRSAILVLLVAAAGAVALLAVPEKEPLPVAPPPAEENGARVYRFRLEHDSKVEVLGSLASAGTPPVKVETRVRLRGRFALWPMGHEDGRRLMQIGFFDLEEHDFVINGEPVFPTSDIVAEHLESPRAILVLEAGGRPVEIRTAADGAPPFERIAQLVFGELQYVLFEESEWQGEELSALGEASVRYRVKAEENGVKTVDKDRTQYRSLRPLEGRTDLDPATVSAKAQLEVQGEDLVRFHGVEEVAVTRKGEEVLAWSMEIEAEREDAPPPAMVAAAKLGKRRAFGAVEVSDRGEAQHLAQRIGDMTRERMLADLNRFGAGGHMPDHNAWTWKVTGLLRRDPALLKELVAQFHLPAMGAPGRALIVDLLVGTGTPEAQAALRDILSAKDRLDAKEWRRHVQGLGLVSDPTPETLSFLMTTYGESQGMDRWVSALAAGGIIHQRLTKSDDRAAAEAADRIMADFEQAEEEESRVRLLGALGNAGVPSHVPRIIALGRDPSVSVRAKSAYALRKHDVPEARQALVELSGDASFAVAQQAINTIGRLTIGEAEIAGLHGRMMSGAIPPETFPGLVSALSPHVHHPLVREIFQAIIAHPRTFNELRARCRTLLAG